MNTMTFTIESVHGVKQTFVLGPSDQSGQCDSLKDQRPERENAESRDASRPAR